MDTATWLEERAAAASPRPWRIVMRVVSGEQLHYLVYDDGGERPLGMMYGDNAVWLTKEASDGGNARLAVLAPDALPILAAALRALKAIRDYEPKEVVKDEFAYDRMVENCRDAARTVLARADDLQKAHESPEPSAEEEGEGG